MKIGFACMSKEIKTKYKTFRLCNFSESRLEETVRYNIQETIRTLKHCAYENIHLFRMSSNLVPFASHDVTADVNYMKCIKQDLQYIKQFVSDNDIRLSMHPSQKACVLSSHKPEIVQNSIKDLEYHYNILNACGDGVITLHVGSKQGGKEVAMQRFIDVYSKLPKYLKDCIALENDDVSYTIDDVMYIHSKTGIPIVLDLHHHYVNKGNSDLNFYEVKNTWSNNKHKCKIHISSPADLNKPRKHADFIDCNYVKDFIDKHKNLDYDICIEAKCKDLAVKKFREDIK